MHFRQKMKQGNTCRFNAKIAIVQQSYKKKNSAKKLDVMAQDKTEAFCMKENDVRE